MPPPPTEKKETASVRSRNNPVLQLPARFQSLSIQFGQEPELNQIEKSASAGIQQALKGTQQPGSKHESPFRLYDLVKRNPELFWKLYNARAYDDLLIQLAYESHLPESKRGKTNYLESIHLTGTTFEPAKTNCLNFWHRVQDGLDNGLVDLVPQPDNPVDPNAIAVHNASEQKRIGWIPAKEGINKTVGRNLALGTFVGAHLLRAEQGKLGLTIQIAIGWCFPDSVLERYSLPTTS